MKFNLCLNTSFKCALKSVFKGKIRSQCYSHNQNNLHNITVLICLYFVICEVLKFVHCKFSYVHFIVDQAARGQWDNGDKI